MCSVSCVQSHVFSLMCSVSCVQSHVFSLMCSVSCVQLYTWYIKINSVFFLTFMGPCIVNLFQYISNKMQRYTVYLYLETALHVSGGTSANHQERKQLYLQHLVFSHRYCYLAFFLNRCTGQSPAQSDDTTGCMYTITT